MGLELERADRVGDALDRVGLAVGEVVGRVDRTTRRRSAGWLAWTIRYSTGSRRLMFGEAMSIFARSTRAPFGNSPARIRANRSRFSSTARSRNGRVRARRGERAARLADLVGGLVVDEGQALLDEVDGPGVQLLEVVGRVVEVLAPVEPQPADVGLDRVDVLLLLLLGFVSSNRRWQRPPNSWAMPKLRQIDFAWPMWR